MLANDQKINLSFLKINWSWSFMSFHKYRFTSDWALEYFQFIPALQNSIFLFLRKKMSLLKACRKIGHFNTIRISEWAERKFSKSLKVNLKFLASQTCRSKKKSNRQKRNLGLMELWFWTSGPSRDFSFFWARNPWTKTDRSRTGHGSEEWRNLGTDLGPRTKCFFFQN